MFRVPVPCTSVAPSRMFSLQQNELPEPSSEPAAPFRDTAGSSLCSLYWPACLTLCPSLCRCTVDDRVTRVAWLNRSTILYAGNDKWSIDNRVVILSNTKTQYSIKIHNVDVYDEGPYTCSVQTDNHPKTSRVHLIVQGKAQLCLMRRKLLC